MIPGIAPPPAAALTYVNAVGTDDAGNDVFLNSQITVEQTQPNRWEGVKITGDKFNSVVIQRNQSLNTVDLEFTQQRQTFGVFFAEIFGVPISPTLPFDTGQIILTVQQGEGTCLMRFFAS